MKKILIASVFATTVMFGAMNVMAQDELMPPPPHREFNREKMREQADKFAKDLGLTEEQKAQAEKIREEGRKKMDPLMKDMRELREKMDSAREENMKEFEAILTSEQKAKMEEIKAEHRAKFGEGRRGRPRHGDKKGPRTE